MIISFAWTTQAYVLGLKTATRRFWNDNYAKKFPVGSVHDAADRSLRFGGKRIGRLRVIALYKQQLSAMTEADFVKEGGYMYWSGLPEYVQMMGGPDKIPWVLEFERI